MEVADAPPVSRQPPPLILASLVSSRNRKHVDTEEKAPPTLPPCKICGNSATGFHYGVNSCGACKGFFLRGLTRKEPFRCLNNIYCNLDMFTSRRRCCQKCRFDRCVNLGMSRTAIKIGRYTYAKKTKVVLEMLHLKGLDYTALHSNDQVVSTPTTTPGDSPYLTNTSPSSSYQDLNFCREATSPSLSDEGRLSSNKGPINEEYHNSLQPRSDSVGESFCSDQLSSPDEFRSPSSDFISSDCDSWKALSNDKTNPIYDDDVNNHQPFKHRHQQHQHTHQQSQSTSSMSTDGHRHGTRGHQQQHQGCNDWLPEQHQQPLLPLHHRHEKYQDRQRHEYQHQPILLEDAITHQHQPILLEDAITHGHNHRQQFNDWCTQQRQSPPMPLQHEQSHHRHHQQQQPQHDQLHQHSNHQQQQHDYHQQHHHHHGHQEETPHELQHFQSSPPRRPEHPLSSSMDTTTHADKRCNSKLKNLLQKQTSVHLTDIHPHETTYHPHTSLTFRPNENKRLSGKIFNEHLPLTQPGRTSEVTQRSNNSIMTPPNSGVNLSDNPSDNPSDNHPSRIPSDSHPLYSRRHGNPPLRGDDDIYPYTGSNGDTSGHRGEEIYLSHNNNPGRQSTPPTPSRLPVQRSPLALRLLEKFDLKLNDVVIDGRVKPWIRREFRNRITRGVYDHEFMELAFLLHAEGFVDNLHDLFQEDDIKIRNSSTHTSPQTRQDYPSRPGPCWSPGDDRYSGIPINRYHSTELSFGKDRMDQQLPSETCVVNYSKASSYKNDART